MEHGGANGNLEVPIGGALGAGQGAAPAPTLHVHTNGHAPGAELLRRRVTSSTSITSSSSSTDYTREAGDISWISSLLLSKSIRVFSVLLCIRLLSAVLTRTFFQPDEYWQSLEVAHRIVFGYGYRTWEWLSDVGASTSAPPTWKSWGEGPVRSFAYPVLFVPIFWALKVTRLDHPALLTLVPRLLQALLSALGDWHLFKLAQRVLDDRAAYITLIVSTLTFYSFYTSSRTFSNTLEASLTSIAISHWPLSVQEPDSIDFDMSRIHKRLERVALRRALMYASVACIIRPTNAIIWVFLLTKLLLEHKKRVTSVSASFEIVFHIIDVVSDIVVICAASSLFIFALDSYMYGFMTFTPLNFLRSNVLRSISLFYGANPFHWYLSQGLAVVCSTSLPFVILGVLGALHTSCFAGLSKARVWFGDRGERDLEAIRVISWTVMWTVAVLSLLGHKEFRFLQPILPLCHILAAYGLGLTSEAPDRIKAVNTIARRDRLLALRDVNSLRPPRDRRITARLSGDNESVWADLKDAWSSLQQRRFSRALLLLNIPVALYLCLFHSAAQLDIMGHLGGMVDSGELRSVAFLMPCHSTPWQSHLHRHTLEVDRDTQVNGSGDHGKAWFITCEPPTDPSTLGTYKDQSDFFYDDPVAYLTARFPASVDPTFPPSPPGAHAQGVSSTGIAQFDLGWHHVWPSHIVLFEALLQVRGLAEDAPTVQDLLREKGYSERLRLWNTLKHEDSRRDGDVVVVAWQHPAQPPK